jgi:DNA-binding NarL/FixJ family response regulator
VLAESTSVTSTTLPLRVGLIEDNQVTRKLMGKLLSKHADCELAGSWSTGEAALAELAALRPDVVLVDLELPGISGQDCLRALSVMLPCSALVVLTAHDDPERVFESLRVGANGYLLKGSTSAELIAGIKAAYAGGSPLSPAVAGMVIRAFKKNSAPEKTVIPLPSLAPREKQILAALAKGMAPKEVAAELFISYETVRDYLKQIYQKLHVRSRTEAVLRYLESGHKPED